jgi:hypothetical protein
MRRGRVERLTSEGRGTVGSGIRGNGEGTGEMEAPIPLPVPVVGTVINPAFSSPSQLRCSRSSRSVGERGKAYCRAC